MKFLNSLKVDIKLIVHVVNRYVLRTSYIWMAIFLFVLILFVLQWLFNLDQLEVIFISSGLTLAAKIDIMIDAFFSLFRFANDITPISMILISLFQALALTLLIYLRDNVKKASKELKGQTASSLGLGLLGVGCVACGGSLLTPILGLVATNVSVTLAERIGDILLLIAVVLSYYSLSKIAFKVAEINSEINK